MVKEERMWSPLQKALYRLFICLQLNPTETKPAQTTAQNYNGYI